MGMGLRCVVKELTWLLDGEGAGDDEALAYWLSSHCSCMLIYCGQQETNCKTK